jgi:hypothetical protein
MSMMGIPIRTVVEPLRQRYTLPDDVSPPPGMTRAEFNAWSKQVCGYASPTLKDGQVMHISGVFYMNQWTYDAMKAEFGKFQFRAQHFAASPKGLP